MEWLNYHHLYYFWTVVEEDGIAAASRRLGVGRPSISVQLKSLESFFGAPPSKSAQNSFHIYSASPATTVSARSWKYSGQRDA